MTMAEEVAKKISQRMERSNLPILVNVSNRHFHITRPHFETLFGKGKAPTKLKDLLQPNHYACKETVTLKGAKGEIPHVRLIAPFRAYTQVEIARTDAFILGINPPVRDSGNVKGSAPITLIGPEGKLDLPEGCLIQMRHIHFSPADAKRFGIKNMEVAKVRFGSGTPREAVYNVLCRVREDMKLECHLDTDEANAVGVKNGDVAIML